MGKHSASSKKHDAPVTDTKTSAPPAMWTGMPSSIADLVEQTNLSSTGVSEVRNSKTPQEAVMQTITHPVLLAVVVGGALMLLSRR